MFEVYMNGRRTGLSYTKRRLASAMASDLGSLFPDDHYYVEEFGKR